MKIKPTKIICVGLNYRDHAKELNMAIPKEPIIFLKPPSALIFNGDHIVYPPQTRELHYEAELAVVISQRGKNIPAEKAGEYIAGYTCANDVTARDLQRQDGQWTRAKSFDTFCAIGPAVVPLPSADNLEVKLLLNGEVKQCSNTSQLIFNVNHLISFISGIMTLEKDDLVLTGTPLGVGPMEKGDSVEVRIEKIGSLINTVKGAEGR